MLVLKERKRVLGSYLGEEKKREGKSFCGGEHEEAEDMFPKFKECKIYLQK